MYLLHFFCGLNDDNVFFLDHRNLNAFTPESGLTAKYLKNGIHFVWCMLGNAQPHPLYALWAAISGPA
jgi:hypothetical protein